jgi:peptidoglycan/xylan/chitin deacetylase (PgdA/CDA1 family)
MEHNMINIFNSEQLYHLDHFEQKIDLFKWKNLSIPILGKQISKLNQKNIKKLGSEKIISINDLMWTTQFDIFANIFYHLSRYEEKWRHFAEETASDHATSVLSRYQELTLPVVDILIDYIDRIIRKKLQQNGSALLRILPWPRGEDFGLALTHDIDLTRAVSYKKRFFNSGVGVLNQLIGKGYKKKALLEAMQTQDARVWAFPELIKFYRKKNWHATFFFLTKRFEGFHYRYNIKNKKFLALIRELHKEGHEIALHSSLRAFDQPQSYVLERKKLEAITRTGCVGLRQHYLRAKYPRLWRLAEAAGFKYDASLAYNYQPGFRAGTSHPFYAYDFDEDRCVGIMEFPLAFFEHNIQKRQDDKITAEAIISRLIDQVATYNGLCVVLLHPSNFLHDPYQKWWHYTIKYLAKKMIFVDTLSGHNDWLLRRRQIKFNIKGNTKGSSTIEIIKPSSLKLFSVELLGKAQLLAGKDIRCTEMKPGFYSIESSKSRFSFTVMTSQK